LTGRGKNPEQPIELAKTRRQGFFGLEKRRTRERSTEGGGTAGYKKGKKMNERKIEEESSTFRDRKRVRVAGRKVRSWVKGVDPAAGKKEKGGLRTMILREERVRVPMALLI